MHTMMTRKEPGMAILLMEPSRKWCVQILPEPLLVDMNSVYNAHHGDEEKPLPSILLMVPSRKWRLSAPPTCTYWKASEMHVVSP